MKKLTWTWKKILVLITAAFGIGTLVSCYGVLPPEYLDEYDDSYYTKQDTSEESEDSEDTENQENTDSQTSDTQTE